MNYIKDIADYAGSLNCHYITHCNMSTHTSFKTGGITDIALFPYDQITLAELTDYIHRLEVPLYIIGNASNLLVSDSGIRGAVIFTNQLTAVSAIDETTIQAECGASLSKLANFALKNELTGLEFAYGIPGTVGGAVYMNAGAYGGCIADVIYTTEYISKLSSLKVLTNPQHEFDYRHSVFMQNDNLILSSAFKLSKGAPEQIRAKMDENMRARIAKQPLEYPSAGSVFKRYPGFYTSQLIDEHGLRGRRIGGAMVSEKHAGFIINYDNATSRDIYDLIALVKEEIYRKYNIKLECEIKMLGDFGEA